MPLRTNLMHAGAPAELAKEICGTGAGALTAAGSSQTDANPLPNAINLVGTVSANQGMILRNDLSVGESQVVVNTSATTVKVYPPVGGNINGGSTNAAVTLAAGKVGIFFCTSAGLNFNYPVSA